MKVCRRSQLSNISKINMLMKHVHSTEIVLLEQALTRPQLFYFKDFRKGVQFSNFEAIDFCRPCLFSYLLCLDDCK